ncbi:hypothetical protein [Dyadobacter sp. MSC1_007]|jgi:hypothetical protein|uniref:hypothetical protein n=1 Tax=Dyadobacter sp. MSC1_007 TaxID=2909264 RepID=UPI00202DECE1|nr:hypothetical protein [Dyadobacter sp. MSC1_007]
MSKKDQHIDKYLHGKLPEPDIQADDAWAQMDGMLNAAAGAAGVSGPGPLSTVWKKLLGSKVLLGTAIGVTTLSTAVLIALHLNPEQSSLPEKNIVEMHHPATEQTPSPIESENSEPALSGIQKDDSLHVATQENGTDIEKDRVLEKEVASEKDVASEKKVASEKAGASERPNGNASEKGTFASEISKKTSPKSIKKQNNEVAILRENTSGSPGNTRISVQRGESPTSVYSQKANQSNTNTKNGETITSNESPGNSTGNFISQQQNLRSLNALKSLQGHFYAKNIDLSKRVIAPEQPVKPEEQQAIKKQEPLLNTLHFGPEWSTTMGAGDQDYMAGSGLDSVNRPLRLLIPGLFVTKNWGRHALTFTFTPNQTYFGNSKIIRQLTDSIPTGDSTVAVNRYNTKLVKAASLAFALQYQYMAARWLSLNAGASYSVFTGALLRAEMENWAGQFYQGPLTKVKRSENMDSYIKPQMFSLKAGVIVHPAHRGSRRIQVGCNLILPLLNVSQDPKHPLKAGNGQVYLRFLIR